MEVACSSRSFSALVSGKKEMKYLFFGGKGGVGKTSVAGAAAFYLAEKLGKKVLISSTNPVHSLTSLFGQDVWKKGIQQIRGTKNLYANEIDITGKKEKYKEEILEKYVQ